MSLTVIEQARINRQAAGILERIQKAEGYFAGVPISSVRIGSAAITTAKIEDGAITTAKIANATIENAKIDTLNASKITTGTLDAARIAAGSITASMLSVTTLSAIVSNLGSVSAGTITGVSVTGGTIRTASSGSRVELSGSPEEMIVYDGTDKRLEMGDGAIIFYGDNSVRTYYGSTIWGQISCSSSSFNLVATADSAGLEISTDDSADIIFLADDVINLIAPTVKFNGTTKTAIIPTHDGYKAVYCAEAPEVWFMDFRGAAKQLDPLFLETVEGEPIEFDCLNGKKLTFAKRKGFADVRFEKKTQVQFERNNRFYAT